MDFKAGVVSMLLFACSVTVFGQEDVTCHPEGAEVCLAERTQQYEGVLSTLDDSTSYRQLCVAQLRSYENCFDQKTKSCDPHDMQTLRDQWDALNRNITDLCLKECPSMLDIGNCKNVTDTSDFKLGLFEKFCRTFNSSLRCAKEFINECAFGVRFYADLLQPNIMQYWRYICNSGCQNIDETVMAIMECAGHLSAVTTKDKDLCLGHEMFKQCVANSTHVCEEVMKIVRFKYRQYDNVDKKCMTTTTASTTVAETTVTTTIPPTEPEWSTPTVPEIDECLDGIDMDMLEVNGDVRTEQVLLLLQIESCIQNKSSNAPEVDAMMDAFELKFVQFYRTVKQRGWIVLQKSIQECSTSPEQSKGCTGHRYGLFPCNNGFGIVASIVVLLLALTSTHLI